MIKMDVWTKFENDRTVLTCLNYQKKLSVTDPNYRKASPLKKCKT